ncbi:hypothetical protein [Burkholderia cepacia]|uniref:hypothetical protein n=1 Tax=Burkholderia cepacia TaxID=292 RepID=UPI002FE29CE4
MGWSIGYDDNWQRDIGYGVPATCDHPDCNAKIDRGLAHVCGGEPYGGDDGCGLYFCSTHLLPRRCERCSDRTDDAEFSPFEPKPDHPEWIEWKLTDPSWQQWRDENPAAVEEMKAVLSTHAGEDR